MKEFNLSKKKKVVKPVYADAGIYYREENVKEFIRLLKERAEDMNCYGSNVIAVDVESINNLAGEKLSNSEDENEALAYLKNKEEKQSNSGEKE